MANSKLSNLAAAGAIVPATDFLYLSQAGADRKLPFSAIGIDDLNDTEEGNWTPVIADASSGGNTATFNANATFQQYKKVGNKVTVCGLLEDINTAGLTAGNTLYVRGLPFTSDSAQYAFGAVDIRLTTPTAAMYVIANVLNSASWVVFPRIYFSASSSSMIVSDLDGATSDIRFSITYFV